MLGIFVVSNAAMSAVRLPTSKIARFAPQDWAILEQALWGKVYKKTTYGSHKLSRLWDREAIGTPEVRQLLATLKFPWHASEVRIFDVGFASNEYKKFLLSEQARKSLRLTDNYTLNANKFDQEVEETLSAADIKFLKKLNPPEHGVLVAQLLAGKSSLPGISIRGEISLLSDVDPLTDTAGKQYLELPGVVNLSKSTFTTDVDKLAPVGEKTLFVTAAGNGFPEEKSDNVILASRALEQDGRVKIMPVGAIDPDGVVSKYSEADHSVVVTAPGEHLFSFDGKKEMPFRRTSAASPAVSGVLADVRSILPQLTQDNAVQLLESTAIKTVTNEVSELNGAGVVNHLKIVRVALRLAEDGYDGELMPANLDAYLDFSQEVSDLIDTSKNATQFFLNLRHAFFLDPNNDIIRLQLADAYRQMELIPQATFYDLPSEAIQLKQVKVKLNQRAKLAKERLKLIPSMDQRIAANIISASDLKIKSLIRLAEDDKAFEQLLKTTGAEITDIKELEKVENTIVKILAYGRKVNVYDSNEMNEEITKKLKHYGLHITKSTVARLQKKYGGRWNSGEWDQRIRKIREDRLKEYIDKYKKEIIEIINNNVIHASLNLHDHQIYNILYIDYSIKIPEYLLGVWNSDTFVKYLGLRVKERETDSGDIFKFQQIVAY